MKVSDHVQEAIQKWICAVGEKPTTITFETIEQLAKSEQVTRRLIEYAVLCEGIFPDRYDRNRGVLGVEGQKRLLLAHVVVVGLGGLGGLVAELLARAGVGHLTLIDGDCYDATNLNRQLHSEESLLGCCKALISARRIRSVNGGVNVSVRSEPITESNAQEFIRGADILVDCLDNVPARFVVEAAGQRQGIKLVHGAIAGTVGQLALLSTQGPGLRALYGNPAEAPERGIETASGNLGSTASALAAMQAGVVISYLAGQCQFPVDRALFGDFARGSFHWVELSDPHEEGQV